MSERKNKKSPKRTAQPVVFPKETSCFTVAIVGGGASGIAAACAIAAGAQGLAIPVRVVVIEKGRKIGSSILRSGNGRCNFSHTNIQPSAFNQPAFVGEAFAALEEAFASYGGTSAVVHKELSSPFHAVSAQDSTFALYAPAARSNAVLRWFYELGLVWQEAPHTDGLLYPFSNKATSVLEVLQAELDRYEVERSCDVEVLLVEKENDRFSLQLQDAFESTRSARFIVDAVVFATGGGGIEPICSSRCFDEMAFVPTRSVLGPLRTDTRFLEGLDGIRAHVRLSCSDRSFSEEGEVLFRAYGISGIVVFNASRFVEAGDVVALDLAPELSLSDLNEMLVARMRSYESRTRDTATYEELLRGFFLPELAEALLSYSDFVAGDLDIAPARAVEEQGIAHIAACIKDFELVVTGRGDVKQSQVHQGGLRLDEVDPKTMEAVRVPKLYVTGEALDVDGPCGGYNLHWAWASGLLAGLSIVGELRTSPSDAQGSEREER